MEKFDEFDKSKIDLIFSMLLNKWYVIVWKDDITKEIADYIEKNWKEVYSDYKKEAIPLNLLDDSDSKKDYDIDLFRYNAFFNVTEESDESSFDKDIVFENIDILINRKRKTVSQVLKMFWIEENLD